MQIIDNVNLTVKGDLQKVIRNGSKMSVAAACFSIYAYQELKKQLEGIEELRFIFTSPTFITEKASKAQREFYIPRISRERSLYGNEFRLDLLEYMKQHEDIETAPKGLHTVVGQTEDSPAGVIFVLRNINDSVNIDNRNRIHPFYMVYISEEGEIVCDYLNPKKLLDTMRLLCRGKGEPCAELCRLFYDETDDGRKMGEISELLSEAINSIIDVKEENDIDSLFKSGGTSALLSAVSGLDDFELICFLVVK